MARSLKYRLTEIWSWCFDGAAKWEPNIFANRTYLEVSTSLFEVALASETVLACVIQTYCIDTVLVTTLTTGQLVPLGAQN